MEKVNVIGFVQEAWKEFESATLEINGVSLLLQFWGSEELTQYGMELMEYMGDMEDSGDETGEIPGVEEINHDEPIFCCMFPDGTQLITNSVDAILERCLTLNPSKDDEIDSCTLLEGCEYRPEPYKTALWHQVEAGEIEVPDFAFYYHFDDMTWVVPTEMCQLGGCDTKLLHFDSEQEAYDAAVSFTRDGKEQKIGAPCASCAAEYFG